MSWQFAILLRMVPAYVLYPILLKKTGDLSRTRRQRAMFFFAMSFSVLTAVVASQIVPESIVLDVRAAKILGMALFTGVAVYSQWRALEMSVSTVALFTMLDDIIPVLLGYVFLGETEVLTPTLIAGILACMGGVALNSFFSARQNRAKEGGPRPWRIFIFIGIYSVIWGVCRFVFRHSALDGLPKLTFMLSWYTGGFLGSSVVFLVRKHEAAVPLTRRGVGAALIMAIVVWGCLLLEYWASTLAPLTVTQPVFQVGEMVLFAMVGLFYFKEIKQLDLKTRIIFAAALIGSAVVTLSY